MGLAVIRETINTYRILLGNLGRPISIRANNMKISIKKIGYKGER
jgi:hypothetical protein